MSLYGSGRSEGVAAAALIAAIVVAVRVLGAWLADAPGAAEAALGALLPALGGVLCYRLLRALGRSRYAGFLCGAAYGLSPWITAIGALPAEQLAAVLAPLALEAACRCDRPSWRAAWLPRAIVCLPLPFLAGSTVVGALAMVLAGGAIVRTIAIGDRDPEHPPARKLCLVVVAAAAAVANLAWLAPLAAWLPVALPQTPHEVLTAHRPSHPGCDLPALLRVPGPVVLTFVLLGVLRRQRHAGIAPWCAVVAAGALPTLVLALPALTGGIGAVLPAPGSASAALWLLLGCVVLGAAGLDDFLDLPLRRRTALPWLLALAVAGAPLLPALGARWPTREWPLTATFLGLTLLLPAWRRLGILRFKNWLAAMVLVALAIPLLQVVPRTVPPAAPGGEVATPPAGGGAMVTAPWDYAGLVFAALVGGTLFLSAMRRRITASTTPAPARPAIVKKAKPSKRS